LDRTGTIRWTAAVTPERTTGFVENDGESIYYETIGEGPTVVLTHGLGGNHAIWFKQLAAFAASWRIVIWDQRGFGNSTRRTGRFGPEPAVDDLRALLDELGVDRAHLVGQSMGGWVVMGFAIRHRDRVRSLVLADSPGGAFTDEVRAAAQEARSGLRLGAGFGRHPALGDRFCRERPDEAALYELIGSFGDKPSDDEMIRLLSACRWPLDQAKAVSVPVLLLCGREDPMAPPAGMAAVAALLSNARLQVIDGCGHSPYFEDADAWNRIVREFLEAV